MGKDRRKPLLSIRYEGGHGGGSVHVEGAEAGEQLRLRLADKSGHPLADCAPAAADDQGRAVLTVPFVATQRTRLVVLGAWSGESAPLEPPASRHDVDQAARREEARGALNDIFGAVRGLVGDLLDQEDMLAEEAAPALRRAVAEARRSGPGEIFIVQGRLADGRPALVVTHQQKGGRPLIVEQIPVNTSGWSSARLARWPHPDSPDAQVFRVPAEAE
jgi:hypothetical protein